MNPTHDVISAFLDGETFDAAALGEALADPDGRALLIDLVALRHLVTASPEPMPIVRHRPRRLLVGVAAAAVVLASVIGYSVGERRGAASADAPPTPTRVVRLAAEWR